MVQIFENEASGLVALTYESDGTIHDKMGGVSNLTNEIIKWLKANNWTPFIKMT